MSVPPDAVWHPVSSFVVSGLGVEEARVYGARRPGGQGPAAARRPASRREEGGVRAGRGEVDADAGGLFDDAGADLEQAQPEGGELGAGERHGTGNGIAQGEHQPVVAGVQDQPELIGEWALAGGSIRGELALVQLDQVFGLASGAIDVFVEMAGLAGERGDDIAGIEAARGGLQAGDDPAFAAPGAGGVGEGGEGPHPVCAGLGPAHLEVVGHLVCEGGKRPIAREAEDVVDAVLLAPGHDLRTAVMAVAPEDDSGCAGSGGGCGGPGA